MSTVKGTEIAFTYSLYLVGCIKIMNMEKLVAIVQIIHNTMEFTLDGNSLNEMVLRMALVIAHSFYNIKKFILKKGIFKRTR